MFKKLAKTPIAYLMAIVSVYSVYDYFEHISRAGSTFNEHPWYWLLFTLHGVGSFIFIILLTKWIFEKLFNAKNLLFEVMAIATWLALYLSLIGPLMDEFLWPFDNLYFRFSFGPFFMVLTGYFLIRILINLGLKKKAFYSE